MCQKADAAGDAIVYAARVLQDLEENSTGVLTIDASDAERVIDLLEAINADRLLLDSLPADQKRALLVAAGKVSRPTRSEMRSLQKKRRRNERSERRQQDSAVLKRTLNRQTRRSSTFVLPASTARENSPTANDLDLELNEPRACYICKTDYKKVHAFYDSLCPACAALNYEKRHPRADFSGKVALVTGARIKIGYQTALFLLRAGARVVVTTRFVADAAQRYAKEPDFESFRDRLEIHGLDLRHIPSVEEFCALMHARLDRLDFLINNAAQTVRRPPEFYQHLWQAEMNALPHLNENARALLSHTETAQALARIDASPAELARASEEFPAGMLDLDGQQVDLRDKNSWRLRLHDVSTLELVEVHLINAIAPFVLVRGLKPLMMRERTNDKHIVNVSAMEAQFSRNKKTDKHPHTNMAKASLNMLTRTSAVDFVNDGIFMNSVDTGWVTDEDPIPDVARKQVVHDFHPPLDAVDGAARVVDPIFTGFATGQHPWGLFFKDYRPVAW